MLSNPSLPQVTINSIWAHHPTSLTATLRLLGRRALRTRHAPNRQGVIGLSEPSQALSMVRKQTGREGGSCAKGDLHEAYHHHALDKASVTVAYNAEKTPPPVQYQPHTPRPGRRRASSVIRSRRRKRLKILHENLVMSINIYPLISSQDKKTFHFPPRKADVYQIYSDGMCKVEVLISTLHPSS